MTLFVLLLAAYGLTFAITTGKAWIVTDYLQKWDFFRGMFACVFCTGTEAGGWMYFFTQVPWGGLSPWTFGGHIVFSAIFGLASGAFCLFTDRFIEALTISAKEEEANGDANDW